MKELPVIDNRKKIFISIVIFIFFGLMIIFYLINRNNFDLQVNLKIKENDLSVLEKRLKAIRINNYKISNNNDIFYLSLKRSSLDKNNLSYSDVKDILLSNHTYEVYLVETEFYDEIGKYIDSKFTYPIDFKSVLINPIITGRDIKKVKNDISPNNQNEYLPFTDIKYTEYGRSKNVFISKQIDDNKFEVTLLDGQLWSTSRINSFPLSSLHYASHPNTGIVQRFRMIGKNYTYTDIKNIALFSKYNYKNPVKLIEIKDLKKKK